MLKEEGKHAPEDDALGILDVSGTGSGGIKSTGLIEHSNNLNVMEIEKGRGVSHQKWVMSKIPLFNIPQKVPIFLLQVYFNLFICYL